MFHTFAGGSIYFADSLTSALHFCWPIPSLLKLPLINFCRPVFNQETDTYDFLRKWSPFSVSAICLVASLVKDGGGKFSFIHR